MRLHSVVLAHKSGVERIIKRAGLVACISMEYPKLLSPPLSFQRNLSDQCKVHHNLQEQCNCGQYLFSKVLGTMLQNPAAADLQNKTKFRIHVCTTLYALFRELAYRCIRTPRHTCKESIMQPITLPNQTLGTTLSYSDASRRFATGVKSPNFTTLAQVPDVNHRQCDTCCSNQYLLNPP